MGHEGGELKSSTAPLAVLGSQPWCIQTPVVSWAGGVLEGSVGSPRAGRRRRVLADGRRAEQMLWHEELMVGKLLGKSKAEYRRAFVFGE